MEPNSPKKIQFAVPLFQSHLDPQAAEHIRKRRPTPATLVIYNDPNASELQLVVEQHFQRHEQMEAGLSDSPDTPSPIAEQQPNGAVAQWAGHSSSETYVSCDEQAGSSEEGGKDQSSKQRSGQEESPHLPKHTHSQLDTLSEELTDRDAVDQPSTTGEMKKLEAGFSAVFQVEEEDKPFTEDQDTQEK